MRPYKINEVCKKYSVTSRALRHWESEGLINSVHPNLNSPREYEEEQLERIEKILYLKKINLPLKDIKSILDGKINVNDILREHRASLCSQITDAEEKVALLQKAISCIDSGADLFESLHFEERELSDDGGDPKLAVAKECFDAVMGGDFELVAGRFAKKLFSSELSAQLEAGWREHILSIGKYEKLDFCRSVGDTVVFGLLFEKYGVTLRLIFEKSELVGFWCNYYERGKRK